MNKRNDTYYRSTGIAPVTGQVTMLVGGCVAGGIVAALYGVISRYNPFIYINFLGTALVGLVAGGAVLMLSWTGKCRSNKIAALIGLLAGLFSLYASWVAWIWTFFEDHPLLVSPGELLSAIQQVAEKGAWELMGDWMPTGVFLYLFWLIEAGIIVGVATYMAAMNTTPFCESCNVWTDEIEDLTRVEDAADPEEMRAGLEAQEWERLVEAYEPRPLAAQYVSVDGYLCPECRAEGFITVNQVSITKDDEGNDKEEKEEIVRNLRVPEVMIRALEQPRLKRERDRTGDEEAGEDEEQAAQETDGEEPAEDADA